MRVHCKLTQTLAAASIAALALLIACGSSNNAAQTAPPTTRERTLKPVAIAAGTTEILPRDLAQYAELGYSAWVVGPGEDQGRKLDLMPAGYTGSNNAARLLSWFTISDIHLTDKESPAESLYFGWNAVFQAGGLYSQAYSPVCTTTTQVLDAAVRTINGLHEQTPFDFGICLGDAANCSQGNELRWFIDTMDGKLITPSSGAHLGADTIDYQKPFQAEGLDPAIPWYQVIGNHDQYFMGVAYPTPKIRAAQIGTGILDMDPNVLQPNATEGSGMLVGVVDGTTALGTVIKGGDPASYATPPTVAADAARLSVSDDISDPSGYVDAFSNTTSLPVGHGFDPANTGALAACYSFVPKSAIPLKVIVLDDTCKAYDAAAGPMHYGGGWIDAERLAWLTAELEAGQTAGQLMIIATHIPISAQADLFDTAASPQWAPESLRTEAEMTALLHQYPNLVLLLAGHRHMSTVTPQPSPDALHPELGYWEVETPSLRDFPRQLRTFDFRRNADNTISVLVTNVDPQFAPGSMLERAFGYAVGAARLFGNMKLDDATSHAYNAELVKQLTPEMQTKIATLGTAIK